MAINDYDRWPAGGPHRSSEGIFNQVQVVGVRNAKHVPSVRQEPAGYVFRESDPRFPFDSDVIVVVDPAQVVELQMSRKRSRLARNAFHHAAVAAHRIDSV